MARKGKRSNDDEGPIEILEEDTGPGLELDFGIIASATILLLTAVVLVMVFLGRDYAAGPLGG